MQCHSSRSHGSQVSQAIRQAITGNVAKLFCSPRPSLKNASRSGCLGWKHSTGMGKHRLLKVSMWVKLTSAYRCSLRGKSRRLAVHLKDKVQRLFETRPSWTEWAVMLLAQCHWPAESETQKLQPKASDKRMHPHFFSFLNFITSIVIFKYTTTLTAHCGVPKTRSTLQ